MAIQSRWEPPEGLNRPVPRPVRLSVQGKVLSVLGVIFLIAGVVLGAILTRQVQQDADREQLLSQKGAEAKGTVIRAWRASDKSRTPMVSYHFPANGLELGGQSSMQTEAWRKIDVGGPIVIRYLPDNPRINHPAEGASSALPAWMPWLPTLSFLFPALVFRWMIRREKRLLAEGSPARGVVTQVTRRKKLIVYYDFKLPTGEEMHGKSSVGAGFGAQSGEQVCILYDPDNPRRNAVYPLETVKLGERQS